MFFDWCLGCIFFISISRELNVHVTVSLISKVRLVPSILPDWSMFGTRKQNPDEKHLHKTCDYFYNISEIIKVPIPKPNIDSLTGKTPRACSVLSYPVHFINGLISQKQFRSLPLIHIYVISYDKTHSVTQMGTSPWACPVMPHPVHFIKSLISSKPFRSPPINHIHVYLCF